MENKVTLIIGGCRSGKSAYALNQADKVKGNSKYFIATSVPTDTEMEKRVEKHQNERGEDWHTIEEPVRIFDTIDQYSKKADVILIDCLTLWASNLMMQSKEQKAYEEAIGLLEKSFKKAECPLYLVTNEVGLGIVPENMLARQFRDLAGLINQRVAKAADRVVMTVAGIEVQIKPRQKGLV